jgi:hypothetical protein
MRRRKLLVGLVAVLLASLVVVGSRFVLPSASERITEANCGDIEEGMTFVEVVAILGPPGDYTTSPASALEPPAGMLPSEATTEVWTTDNCAMYVAFDVPRGRVMRNPIVMPVFRWEEQSAIELFRWRIERQWRRWFSGK